MEDNDLPILNMSYMSEVNIFVVDTSTTILVTKSHIPLLNMCHF